MISGNTQRWIDFGCALAFLAAAAFSSSDALSAGLIVLAGGGWILWAWTAGLSMGLTTALLFLAVQSVRTEDFSPMVWGSIALGTCAWTLAMRYGGRWTAIGVGVLWGSAAVGIPGAWPLLLFSLPRLGHLLKEEAGWVRGFGLLATVAGLAGGLTLMDAWETFFQRPAQPDQYTAWIDLGQDLFARSRFWVVVPIAGVLELGQKSGEDRRFSGHGLVFPGLLICLCFVPPALAVGLLFAIGLPVSSILLGRWFYALPHAALQGLFCAAVLLLAAQFVMGGAV